MLIKISNDRTVEIEEENFGTQNENRIETLSFELPEEYSNFTKKIVFITNDGNYWDLIEEDDTYILKNNITKYRKFYAYVWLVDLENNTDFRSKVFKIELNKNENPDDYTPSEEQISGFDTMMQELNEAIEEVKQLPSMKYEIVEELPTEDIDTHTIYLILREEPEGNNYYDEYLYINNSWEKIGSTDVDLSDLIDDIENLENRVFSERNVESEGNTLILENTEEDMGLEVSEIDGWTEQETYEGYNLFTTNGNVDRVTIGITKKSISESEILFNGTTSQAENILLKDNIFTLPSGTYTMKTEVDTSKITRPIGDVAIYLRNMSGNTSIYEVTISQLISSSGVRMSTFTLSDDTNIRFQIYTNTAGIIFNNASFKFTLVSGSETKPYEQYVGGTASPNPTYPQSISVATGTQEVLVSNSSAYNKDFKDLPNTYQAVKYIQSDGNQYLYLNLQWKNTNKIEAIIGTDDEYNNNVIFSESSSASVWIGFSNSTTMSSGGFTNLTITPQTTTTSYKTLNTITFSYSLTSTGNIRWGTYATSTYNKTNRIASLKLYDTNNTLIRNMVACYRKSDNVIGMYDLIGNVFYTNEGSGTFAKGDDLQSQTKTLHLGDIELAKIGTYQDRIYKNNDKWYIEKNIGKVVLNGSETGWGTQNDVFCIEINDILTQSYEQRSIIVLSNYFLGAITTYRGGMNNLTIAKTIDNGKPKQLGIRYDAFNNVVADFKTWLSTHNTEVRYVLATPTITEITDTTLISDLNALQHLKQYNDTTIITIDDIREYQVTLESDRIVVIEEEQVEQNSRIAELEEENSYLSSIIDQIIPKETAEGSSITLDNTLQGKLKLNERKGDTSQFTTSGYQLIDLTLAKLKTYNTSGTWNNNVYTISGVTITINDDMSIKVNGTTTAQVGLLLAGGTIPYPTGTYYLSGAINGSNDTYDVRIFNYDGTSIVAQCFTGTKQVAIVNNSQSYNMALIVRNGVTCNNTMFYPMLSTTNTSDYEPYTNGASPNPTYPQDINVVTGQQEVVVQNKNLAYIEAEGKYRSSASGNFSINANYNGYIAKVRPSTTYSGSFTNVASNYNDVSNLCCFDKNMNFISGNSYNTANKTFTTPSNCAYVTMAVKTTITDFQVELGSTATSYIEHQEQTKPLHLGDIELAKIGTYQDRIFESSGKNKYDSNNVIENALIQPSSNKIISTSECTTIWYKCTPNTTYTLLRDKGDRLVIGGSNTQPTLNGDITTLYDVGVNEVKTYTFNSGNFEYIAIYISRYNSSKPTIVMINEGSTALPYEPYGSDKWYIEKNNIEKDKDYLVANVGQVDTITNYARIRVYLNNACISTPTGLCSHLKFEASYSGQSNHFYAQSNYAYLIIDKTLLSTIDVTGAKAYLNTLTGLKILYPLATPTYTEITNTTLIEELNELEKMMSYSGQTNISVSGNLPMIINVTALKNLS